MNRRVAEEFALSLFLRCTPCDHREESNEEGGLWMIFDAQPAIGSEPGHHTSRPGPLEFFDAHTETGTDSVMRPIEFQQGVPMDAVRAAGPALRRVSDARLLFRSTEPASDVSLLRFRLDAGCILPAHTHDADCLYYVTRGSVLMGSRVISEGEGFFVPAGRAYAYEAGPDGTEVLEFRTSTDFDIEVTESSPSRWALIKERAEAARPESA